MCFSVFGLGCIGKKKLFNAYEAGDEFKTQNGQITSVAHQHEVYNWVIIRISFFFFLLSFFKKLDV